VRDRSFNRFNLGNAVKMAESVSFGTKRNFGGDYEKVDRLWVRFYKALG
jgi:hypothetical protein